MSLKHYKKVKNGCEIVAATGSMIGSSRKILAVSFYIPPSHLVKQVREAIDTISQIREAAKTEITKPYVIVAGDVNKKDFSGFFFFIILR